MFSRAYVRHVARDPHLEVPSPTYLLQHVYDDHVTAASPPVHHFDLYRLTGPAEMSKLGLGSSFASAVSLLEWAERLGHLAPSERLDVYIGCAANGVGTSRFEGDGSEAAAAAADATLVAERGGAGEEDEEEGDDEYGDEDEDEDVDPMFVDRKPRVIRLEPRGTEWRRRVDALVASVRG